MKTNLDKFYKTDKDLETEGIWYDISDEVAFKIKRFGGMNSQSVKASSSKYYKPYARMVKAGTLPPEKEREVLTKTFVSSSVIDWKGIEIDGESKDYNFEDCVNVLIGMPDLTDSLIEYASDYENYREDLGNS